MNTPLIKWTGSKRPIAKKIVSYFPKDIDCYYEPFLGGGSVFFELLKSDISVKKFRLSDINGSLIDVFNLVKDNPDKLIRSYREKWEEFQRDKYFYLEQRKIYNITGCPLCFYFLTRTCYNGTIRYNRRGDFNVSSHFGRPGMAPEKVEEVIISYSALMQNRDIEFIHETYDSLCDLSEGDVIYLDPPYTNTKALYFGNIDIDRFLYWLGKLKCSWFMNLNGCNSTDNEEDVKISYTGKESLSSGNSSFSRMKKKQVKVTEYFYYRIA